jgi:hypothetical protein
MKAPTLLNSQSGPVGWLIADAKPKLVKAVVAVDPAGPPFQNTVFGTDKARAWGVADIPITYDPPVNDPGELKIEQEAQPDGPDLVGTGYSRRRRGALSILRISRRS